jgi:hypothetical protein
MSAPDPTVEIAPASASAIADGRDHRLDPRVVPLHQTAGWIATFVIALIAFVALSASWVAGGPTLAGLSARGALWIAGVALLGWRATSWPAIAYRHASYRVDHLGIEIRRGVIWRTVINVPRSRVQHTDVSQGPLERRYGLGTLAIYTAGTDHARVGLAGLEHARALAIRSHLLPAGGGDAV